MGKRRRAEGIGGKAQQRKEYVARGDDDTVSLVDASTLTSGAGVAEPRKYLLRQVVLDLAGICQRGHGIYEGREFIVHCVEGWHLGEKKGSVERGNEREFQ